MNSVENDVLTEKITSNVQNPVGLHSNIMSQSPLSNRVNELEEKYKLEIEELKLKNNELEEKSRNEFAIVHNEMYLSSININYSKIPKIWRQANLMDAAMSFGGTARKNDL